MAIREYNQNTRQWQNTLVIGKRYTIEQLKQANRDAGYYWFTPESMRFFNSRVLSDVFVHPQGWLFVSSERYTFYDSRTGREHSEPRKYTIRIMHPNGNVNTVNSDGEIDDNGFQAYASRSGAINAARRIAEQAREEVAT